MSKKTTILIIFLFLVTCGLLYVALVTPPYKKPSVSLTPTPTPFSVNAHTVLSLVPAPASESSTLKQYTLAVQVQTNSNNVNGVQVELAYNPQAVTNVTVTPGDFFTQPTILVNNIDQPDGLISYAITQQLTLPGRNGSGTVALISFDSVPGFSGTTSIIFRPKSAVSADRILESVLRTTNNYVVTIKPNSGAIPAASTSAQ